MPIPRVASSPATSTSLLASGSASGETGTTPKPVSSSRFRSAAYVSDTRICCSVSFSSETSSGMESSKRHAWSLEMSSSLSARSSRTASFVSPADTFWSNSAWLWLLPALPPGLPPVSDLVASATDTSPAFSPSVIIRSPVTLPAPFHRPRVRAQARASCGARGLSGATTDDRGRGRGALDRWNAEAHGASARSSAYARRHDLPSAAWVHIAPAGISAAWRLSHAPHRGLSAPYVGQSNRETNHHLPSLRAHEAAAPPHTAATAAAEQACTGDWPYYASWPVHSPHACAMTASWLGYIR